MGQIPSSPQKRQILTQSTSLLKSQLMELLVNNTKIDKAKDKLMQSTSIKERISQPSSETRSHEDKRDRVEKMNKENVTTYNKEILANQRVDTAAKNYIEVS